MERSKNALIEAVFAGNSEMATRMRALDWSATPLGPVEQWPQALRTSIRIMLDSARAFEPERQPEIERLRRSAERLAQTSRLYRELQRTNEELQLQAGFLQQLPVSAWTLRPDGTPDFVNQVWLDYSGQTLDFVRSHPEAWMAAVHPEDREAASRAFWDGVQSGQGFAFETRSLRALDGTYRWHLSQAVVLRDAEGRVLKFVGTSTDIDNQKRAEEELRASEISLRQTLDTIPGLVSRANSSGMIELANQQLLTYFGKTTEEMNSWSTSDVVHPDDLPRVTAEITHSFKTGTPFDSELRYRRADGVHRWFQARSLPFRGADGEVAGWYFLLTDIEDRKRAEEALRLSEYEARLIVDSIPGIIGLASPSGNIDMVSRQALEFFGQTIEELREWGTNGTIHPEDLPSVIAAYPRAISAGRPYEFPFRLRRWDGVYRWFQERGFPLRDKNGDIARWYLLITDIDDQKRAEEALRETEHESRLIVDSIPGMIAVLSAGGEVERLNQPILDYLGKSLEESRQWAADGTVHPDDRSGYVQAFEQAFATGNPVEYDAVRVRRFDGVYRWLNMRGLPLRDRQGHIVRWYFLLTEIDDRKRAEEALRQAQGDLARINRVTTMGELTASLAHEISQPISGAMTNANVGLRKLAGDNPNFDEVRGVFTKIARDAKRASEIISRIRSQFERGSASRETLDVSEIVRETVALLRDESMRHNISVRTELTVDLPQTVGDRVQLQQVAMNLIVNGIEAMKDVEGMREMVIKSQRSEVDQILVSISDTGLGFPPELAEQIFDPFFTTKPHGTGMGLRISRSIIESHGGRLWAEPAAGRGATFYLNLPAAIPGEK